MPTRSDQLDHVQRRIVAALIAADSPDTIAAELGCSVLDVIEHLRGCDLRQIIAGLRAMRTLRLEGLRLEALKSLRDLALPEPGRELSTGEVRSLEVRRRACISLLRFEHMRQSGEVGEREWMTTSSHTRTIAQQRLHDPFMMRTRLGGNRGTFHTGTVCARKAHPPSPGKCRASEKEKELAPANTRRRALTLRHARRPQRLPRPRDHRRPRRITPRHLAAGPPGTCPVAATTSGHPP